MGIYSDLLAYVDHQGVSYVSTNTKIVADALEPAAVTFAGIYIIFYGLAHLRGMVKEPIMEFAMKAIRLILIFGIGLKLWMWNEYVVDTFVTSPDQLNAALTAKLTGSPSSGQGTFQALDIMFDKAFAVGNVFWKSAGILSGNVGGYLAAFFIWIMAIAVTAYGAFLILLAKIFLHVLIAAGPLVIMGLLFQATSKFFESWISQLANYALIPFLVTLTNIFVIGMFQQAAEKAEALGGSITLAECFPMIVTGLLSVMALAQVSSIASGLAGGISISTMGVGRRVFGKALAPAQWATRKASKAAGGKIAEKTSEQYKRAKDWMKSRRNNVSRSGGNSDSRATSSGSEQRQARAAAAAALRAKLNERRARKAA